MDQHHGYRSRYEGTSTGTKITKLIANPQIGTLSSWYTLEGLTVGDSEIQSNKSLYFLSIAMVPNHGRNDVFNYIHLIIGM